MILVFAPNGKSCLGKRRRVFRFCFIFDVFLRIFLAVLDGQMQPCLCRADFFCNATFQKRHRRRCGFFLGVCRLVFIIHTTVSVFLLQHVILPLSHSRGLVVSSCESFLAVDEQICFVSVGNPMSNMCEHHFLSGKQKRHIQVC